MQQRCEIDGHSVSCSASQALWDSNMVTFFITYHQYTFTVACKFMTSTAILLTCQYPSCRLDMHIKRIVLFTMIKIHLNSWSSFLLVCMFIWQRVLQQKRGRTFWHAQCVCVCVWGGHSTVPYIKLSAPQLSSSSKLSLMAWGVLVSQLWIKSKECPKP